MADLTAKVDEMKAVEAPEVMKNAPKVYEIPMTQTMPKADGSGDVEVLVQVAKVTKAQLIQGIANANKQVVAQQAQIAKLQAQLDKINSLEG